MSLDKKRLDAFIQEMHPHLTRSFIQECIKSGKVFINGVPCLKPGTLLADATTITMDLLKPKFVSRGGLKLEAALNHFKIDVKGKVILDGGISTGGFTDCLLQQGAAKIYGVDVGTAQLHESLRHDTRIILQENTNLRHLEHLPELVDVVTLDLSFISLKKIIPGLTKFLKPEGFIIALIKPQFEVERHEIRRGGLVTDQKIHLRVIESVSNAFAAEDFAVIGIIESPITGTSGNKEFLGLFKKLKN